MKKGEFETASKVDALENSNGVNLMTAEVEYKNISTSFNERPDVEIGQMFGKSCLKTGGKAFMAQHLDYVIFKLGGTDHSYALMLPGAHLWDPSGKGRPMKEWIALPMCACADFHRLALAALTYVQK